MEHRVANPGERYEAIELAKTKLTGSRLQEAKAFIRQSRRSAADIKRLKERLAGLPDLHVPENYRTPLKALSDDRIERIRKERAAGALLRELADRYRVSVKSVSRYCAGIKPGSPIPSPRPPDD